jgi:hypothetical protein
LHLINRLAKNEHKEQDSEQPPNNVEELYRNDSAFDFDTEQISTFVEEDVREICNPLAKPVPHMEVPKVFINGIIHRCLFVHYERDFRMLLTISVKFGYLKSGKILLF